MDQDILSKEDKESIVQALRDAERLRRELQRAKTAGLDVSDLEKRLSDAQIALQNLKRVYVDRGT